MNQVALNLITQLWVLLTYFVSTFAHEKWIVRYFNLKELMIQNILKLILKIKMVGKYLQKKLEI